MCGVAGVFHYSDGRTPDRELLTQMTRILTHRGPDSEGFLVDGGLGLGHRRLAIVDLRSTGHQPMVTEDGGHAIAYNGEFYDHSEYRARLAADGVHFRGTSDTETLLYLLRRDGPSRLRDLSAIFGLAFWDRQRQTLVLARDPLGVKQLYYHDDGRRVVFASEIKALLLDPTISRELDREAVNQYLHFHTPLFERTFFRNIRQLRPGEFLQVDRNGVTHFEYFSLTDFATDAREPGEQVELVRAELSRTIERQFMSDVQVGAFFSGGIDSSAIAAFALRNGHRAPCFGVHFTDQGVIDERPYQEAAAQALGLDLQLTTLDGSTFAQDMPQLLWYQDQPVVGHAMLPMYHVARLAASQVKVCVGGQGADEIFGGYARYAIVDPGRVLSQWFLGRRLGRGGGDGAGARRLDSNLWKQLLDSRTIRRLLRVAARSGDWRRRYYSNFAQVDESDWKSLFDPEVVSSNRCRALFEAFLAASPARDPVDKVMHWDVSTYLAGLFHQDDRMSMANSLESRVPMADPKLVRLAFGLGSKSKIRGGSSKWVLRQAVSASLPEKVLSRRKVGFDTPAARWMKTSHADFVRDTLTSQAARNRGLTNPDEVARLLDSPDEPLWFERVWKALAIECWARVVVDVKGSERPG